MIEFGDMGYGMDPKLTDGFDPTARVGLTDMYEPVSVVRPLPEVLRTRGLAPGHIALIGAAESGHGEPFERPATSELPALGFEAHLDGSDSGS